MSREIYEDRYLVFLNIVDFRNMLDRSLKGGEVLRHILNSLYMDMGNQYAHFVRTEIGFSEAAPDPGFIVTSFSSFIAISSNAAISQSTLGLLIAQLVAQAAADDGIFYSGVVTRGLLHHEGNIIYGPAMVRADYLRKRYDRYPRVVMDPDLDEDIELRPVAFGVRADEESPPVFHPLVVDSSATIDFFNPVGLALARAIWEENYDRHCRETGEENIQQRPRYWRDWAEDFVEHLKKQLQESEADDAISVGFHWLTVYFFSKYVLEGGQKYLKAESTSWVFGMASTFPQQHMN